MGSPAAVVKKIIKPSAPAPVAPIPKVDAAPTTAEVSQATATDVYDTRKEKRKGRSPTIMTSATGVSGGLTLGSPSLLGR